jgi:hypothetical protein
MFFVLLLALMLAACTQPPDYPIEPVIEFEGMTKQGMVQDYLGLGDSTTVTLRFTDGDGDLGDGSTQSVFLTDLRQPDADVTGYVLPLVPTEGSGNGISGKIRLRLYTTCCIYPDGIPACQPNPGHPTDTVVYRLYIKDRAGHESNHIELPPITLYCN